MFFQKAHFQYLSHWIFMTNCIFWHALNSGLESPSMSTRFRFSRRYFSNLHKKIPTYLFIVYAFSWSVHPSQNNFSFSLFMPRTKKGHSIPLFYFISFLPSVLLNKNNEEYVVGMQVRTLLKSACCSAFSSLRKWFAQTTWLRKVQIWGCSRASIFMDEIRKSCEKAVNFWTLLLLCSFFPFLQLIFPIRFVLCLFSQYCFHWLLFNFSPEFFPFFQVFCQILLLGLHFFDLFCSDIVVASLAFGRNGNSQGIYT